ncbi:hypothetical protein GQX74_003934 [Glossina fuscipes]|nr:hypothetical protein GQX74_003934 [Glossina fuscipes]
MDFVVNMVAIVAVELLQFLNSVDDFDSEALDKSSFLSSLSMQLKLYCNEACLNSRCDICARVLNTLVTQNYVLVLRNNLLFHIILMKKYAFNSDYKTNQDNIVVL